MDPKKTSWGGVSSWYYELLSEEGTYQSDVILPNLERLLSVRPEEKILDLACGEGFFSRHLKGLGAEVVGVDIADELIQIAKKASPEIEFRVGSADNLSFLKNESFDSAVSVLAMQNIEKAAQAIQECGRVLKSGGRFIIVLNHPAFRIPKKTSWGYDEEAKIQYRRVDGYLGETREAIQMEPGKKGGRETVSFHRSLQYYFKALSKGGFLASRLEEWTSHKKSLEGPRKAAEDRARKEIPMFLMIEAVKK